jgi:hypothetical protein
MNDKVYLQLIPTELCGITDNSRLIITSISMQCAVFNMNKILSYLQTKFSAKLA